MYRKHRSSRLRPFPYPNGRSPAGVRREGTGRRRRDESIDAVTVTASHAGPRRTGINLSAWGGREHHWFGAVRAFRTGCVALAFPTGMISA
jgi:hypothetical protein